MLDHQDYDPGFFEKIKKYLPFAALTLLTFSLMIFFKYNKQDINLMIEEGKVGLVDFYTQNLKPLLFKTDISNEDVFNFALNKNIPIDKEDKKILQINDETSGYDVFTIQSSTYQESTDNYQKFAQNLELNDEERSEVESILDSYKDEIYASILVNENNTIAVNPNIRELQQAIVTDIALFTRKVHESRDVRNSALDLALANTPAIPAVVDMTTGLVDENFIFFTPDTVFTEECKFDREVMKLELAKFRNEWAMDKERMKDFKVIVNFEKNKIGLDLDTTAARNIRFVIDSSDFAVALPKLERINFEDHKKIQLDLENLGNMLKAISFNGKSITSLDKDWGSEFAGDWEDAGSIKINIDIDSLVGNSLKFIQDMNLEELDDLDINIDSLLESIHTLPKDSINKSLPRRKRAPNSRN